MPKEFRKFLSELIVAKGTNVQKICQQTGMSRTTIDRHLVEQDPPSIQKREQYLRAFSEFSSIDHFDAQWMDPKAMNTDVSQFIRIAAVAGLDVQRVLDESLDLWIAEQGENKMKITDDEMRGDSRVPKKAAKKKGEK